MSNYLLRPTPDFSRLPLPPFLGDDKRFASAESEESGFRLVFDLEVGPGVLEIGAEGKDGEHDVSVTDPDFAPFFVENFKDVKTDSKSAFVQWSAILDDDWYVEFGGRLERVEMSAGEIDAFPARLVDMNPAMWGMGTPPRAVWMLRQGFNSRERARKDDNNDLVAKLRYQLTAQTWSWKPVTAARRARRCTRSVTSGFRWKSTPDSATAINYVGNPDLAPETSDQFELGFDWSIGTAWFSPRFFVRDVDDYIQGVPATHMAVVGVSRNANGDPTPLMFANTEAEFRGFDLTFGFPIDDRWRVEGMASQVNAERGDISDHLYRVNPNNIRASLLYETGNFSARIEQVVVMEQDNISRTNTYDPMNPNNSSIVRPTATT